MKTENFYLAAAIYADDLIEISETKMTPYQSLIGSLMYLAFSLGDRKANTQIFERDNASWFSLSEDRRSTHRIC